MKKLCIVLIGLFCITLLTSCSKQSGEQMEPSAGPEMPADQGAEKAAEAEKGDLTLGVIPKGSTHEFWKSIHAGAIRAAEELNIDIVWKGPIKENDRQGQIKIVEDMIVRGVDGIVLAPLDAVALARPVRDATRQNIPVVIIDSGLKSDDYVSFVATDNHHGGELAGEHLTDLLGKEGKVIMLRYEEGSASTMKREQGFIDAVSENPGIELVSSNQYGGATVETAMKASENLLAPHLTGGSLDIDGIFCPNESTTFGMLRVLQDAGVAGDVKFVGFDSSEKLVDAMENRQLHGLVLQDPMKMGYLGVKTLTRHLRGEDVDKRISTGETLVTPDNMDRPKMQDLLNPPYEKWLQR